MSASLFLRTALLFFLLSLTSCQWISESWQAFDTSLRLDPLEDDAVSSPEETLYPNASEVPPPPETVRTAGAVNRSARVAVLGYHDFSNEDESKNDMVLPAHMLRAQMERIRSAGLPVISMSQFLAWRAGQGSLPPFSILITIDDGWKATHDIALPIFREYDVPFTVFLYTDYIESGDRSLSHDEIRNILDSKGTIGSHSISHQNLSQRKDKSEAAYLTWLNGEFTDSLSLLQSEFASSGEVSPTFAYPFGIYNDFAIEAAKAAGYQACFTVNAEKVSWSSDSQRLGRYIIQGTNGANFDDALAFGQTLPSQLPAPVETKPVSNNKLGSSVLSPSPHSKIVDRLPLISADLSSYENIVPDSIKMQVSGVGEVGCSFAPNTSLVTYQVLQPLRREHTQVRLQFQQGASAKKEALLWTFSLDRMAIYEQKTLETGSAD